MTTLETIETMFNLTRQDVRALKHADAIAFDHKKDGSGEIRAIVRGDRSDTGFEQTHYIKACLSTVESYRGGYDAYTGYHLEMNVQVSATMQTLVRQLREGSAFALLWRRGNQSPVLDDAGMVRDELRIRITRGAKSETFIVAIMVGKDNTARMIRGAH